MPPRVHILAVGSLDPDYRAVFEHYRRLLRGRLELAVREVREVPLQGRSPQEVLREEGRRLLKAWPENGTTVVLDERGRSFDSLGFAQALQTWLERGPVCFVIGGPLGLASEVKRRADEQLSLSALSFPHQLARVVLVEQLFRAVKIARGEVYHHG